MKDDSRPAFSYPVKVGHISANAVTVRLSANESERQALAELWDVREVLSLSADLQIARWKKDGVKIKGDVTARIVQSCVVTLEPVEADIKESDRFDPRTGRIEARPPGQQ